MLEEERRLGIEEGIKQGIDSVRKLLSFMKKSQI